MFATLSLLLDDTPHDGPLNMAIDEVLVHHSPTPLLRVYHWTAPFVSFGYFGEQAEVAARWPGRPLVRRWTGGGEVPHGDDFTYTVIVPRADPFARLSVRESYRCLHAALADLIPGAILAQSDAPNHAACFARPVVADVMHAGQKVAGAAQRRGTFGLLHQGSVQNVSLPADLAKTLAHQLSPQVTTIVLTPALLAEAAALAAEKYGTEAWLRRR